MIFRQWNKRPGLLIADFDRKFESTSRFTELSNPSYPYLADIENQFPELYDFLKLNELIFDYKSVDRDCGINLFPLSQKYCCPTILISIAKFVSDLDRSLEILNFRIDGIRVEKFALDRHGKIWIIDFSIFRRLKSKSAYNSYFQSLFEEILGPVCLSVGGGQWVDISKKLGSITAQQFVVLSQRTSAKLLLLLGNKSELFRRVLLRIVTTPIFFVYLRKGLFYSLFSVFKSIFRENSNERLETRANLDWLIEDLTSAVESEGTLDQKWSNYHDHLNLDEVFSLARSARGKLEMGSRVDNLRELFRSIEFKTCLDIGANNGFFSLLAADTGASVISSDNDLASVDQLYRRILVHQTKDIFPIFLDFTKLDNHDVEFLRSELVIALGFVHHMRLVEHMAWSEIVHYLRCLTTKTLLTEFKVDTGAKDRFGGDDSRDLDYDLQSFCDALRSEFPVVQVLGGFSMKGFTSERILVRCDI